MANINTLRARRDAIEESIAVGILSITVDGQTTTFASLAERQKVLNRINRQIDECLQIPNKRPVCAQLDLGGQG